MAENPSDTATVPNRPEAEPADDHLLRLAREARQASQEAIVAAEAAMERAIEATASLHQIIAVIEEFLL